jgi:hypothetical protein
MLSKSFFYCLKAVSSYFGFRLHFELKFQPKPKAWTKPKPKPKLIPKPKFRPKPKPKISDHYPQTCFWSQVTSDEGCCTFFQIVSIIPTSKPPKDDEKVQSAKGLVKAMATHTVLMRLVHYSQDSLISRANLARQVTFFSKMGLANVASFDIIKFIL